jgi:hypothetical protein
VSGEPDWKTQRAVMTLLLFAFPRAVTGRALKEQIGDSDAVDNAVVELALVGLVWSEGKRAAANPCRSPHGLARAALTPSATARL